MVICSESSSYSITISLLSTLFFALIRKVHSYMCDTLTHSQHYKCISYIFFIIIVFYNYESLTEGFFFLLTLTVNVSSQLVVYGLIYYVIISHSLRDKTFKHSPLAHLPIYTLFFFSFLLHEKFPNSRLHNEIHII